MRVTENAQCSTITCADGWSADSSAEGTKCAGLVCDSTGADNALCCDGATYLLLITLFFGAGFCCFYRPRAGSREFIVRKVERRKRLDTGSQIYMEAYTREVFENLHSYSLSLSLYSKVSSSISKVLSYIAKSVAVASTE